MAKMGRPIEKNPRSHVLSVRMTGEEWERLHECAKFKDSTITSVAREAIIKSCKRILSKSSGK